MKRKDILNIIYDTLTSQGNFVEFENAEKLVYGGDKNGSKSVVLLDNNELGFKISLRVGSFSSESNIEIVLKGCAQINRNSHLVKTTLEKVDDQYLLYANIEYVCYTKRELMEFITNAEMYLYLAVFNLIDFLDNNIKR